MKLIIPTVSCGNIPQLLIDLIVNSNGLKRTGEIHSNCVLNVFGPGAFGEDFAMALEIYHNKDLCVLQMRSPCIPNMYDVFAMELVTWIESQKFDEVLVLCSADASFRLDLEPIRTYGPMFNQFPTLTTFDLEGSGILNSFMKFKKFEVSLFLVYCLEGDNTRDSLVWYETLKPILNLEEKIIPKCWFFEDKIKEIY